MITRFKLFENGEVVKVDGVQFSYSYDDARAFIWDKCSNEFYVAETNMEWHATLRQKYNLYKIDKSNCLIEGRLWLEPREYKGEEIYVISFWNYPEVDMFEKFLEDLQVAFKDTVDFIKDNWYVQVYDENDDETLVPIDEYDGSTKKVERKPHAEYESLVNENAEYAGGCYYFEDDARAFGFDDDSSEMLVAPDCDTYHYALKDGHLSYQGRLWLDRHVISFWEYPPMKSLKQVLLDISEGLQGDDKIDWSEGWRIEICMNPEDEVCDHIYQNILIPIEKYTGSMNPETRPEHQYEAYTNKMAEIAEEELKRTPGGNEYFDKIDAALKLPKNLDVIQKVFQQIQQDQNNNFNLILTGGFGEWIHSLIKKGVLKVPGNLVTSCGSIRGKDNKLGKITKGKEVDIIHKKDDIDNQQFILFDDSYYSGSTKKALEDYLKKHGSEIAKTYVLYDGSDIYDPNRKSLYKYYDYHTGTKLGVDLLIDYLYSLDTDIPRDSVRDKIVKGEINTINDVRIEVSKILQKFGKPGLDKLTHRENKRIVKRFESFENEKLEFIML